MASQKNNKNTASGEPGKLTQKDLATFKTVMDLYNQKQYKKGLKTVETLIAKHPNYGEALSFKALLLSNIDPSKSDEIMRLAKDGLKNDVKSYICWYVLGAIYKQRKLYKDTFKCFTMALKIDPMNDRLMKDLYAIAIELGDYASFKKLTKQALEIRTKYYKEWMAFAFAQHMCGNVDAACRVVQEANALFEGKYDVEPFELSSSLIYWAAILEENGKYEECIKVLNTKKKLILDTIMRLEYVGRVAFKSKQWDVAHDAYAQLVKANPDNARYVLLFIATHKTIRDKRIFQMPLDRQVVKGVNENLQQNTDDALKRQEADFVDMVMQGTLPPIMFSEEIFDIEGEYSTSNWCGENLINRTYDQYVNVMRQKTEKRSDATKDEQLFCGCYSYGDYVNRISKAFDINQLPKPATVNIDDVDGILENYLKEYPIAKTCVYNTRPKINPWSRYPLYIFTRELTSDESKAIMDVLNTLKKNNYLRRALTLSFTVNDHIRQYHCIVRPLVESGCLSIFRYFSHGCTLSTAYRLLKLLTLYQENLTAGFTLGHNIEQSQIDKGSVDDGGDEHRVVSENYLVLIQIVTARVYDHLGLYHEGLQLLEQILKTTPTAVDAYLVMGKIYTHLGAFEKSKKAFCMASDIDRSDRQTSSKAAKALLRANEFEASRYKWKNFLVEDNPEDAKGGKKGENADKTNDAPPEVKSMKYELMGAQQYRNIYLQNITSKSKDSVKQTNAEEMLKKAHDIYAMVLEKQHEIYQNQLDFHNYCLNRLQYRTYYIFHRIKSGYATLAYFIEAAKGILWTTAEMRKQGIQHKTVCNRVLEEVTNDHNIDYCIDMIKVVSSQRVFNTGLYSAIYEFGNLVELPLVYKIQCILRAYQAAHRNPIHHHLYPMVSNLIRQSQYKKYTKAISQLLPKWGNMVIDENKNIFTTVDGRELTDREAADLYLKGIIAHIQKVGVMDSNHGKAILQSLCSESEMLKEIAKIDFSYVKSIPTFSGLNEHRLELMKLITDMKSDVNITPIEEIVGSIEAVIKRKYPESGVVF
ncbi:tetratricopeptide repeat-containing protein, putative [Babesia ovis]|uniref:Tetratricopeptide repeat-containing protein, putative n=1 Tax=Babesia ovis TaxID=5869 RepID=A0A9W5TAV4_BABOV|nr:tetratricopeptide repeat-containing protein, putative [Babesia ovis]